MKHEAPAQTLVLISEALALIGERIDNYEVWQAVPCPCALCGRPLATTAYFIDDMTGAEASALPCVRLDSKHPFVNQFAKRGLFCETHGLLGFHKDGRYYSTVGGKLVSAESPAGLAKVGGARA